MFGSAGFLAFWFAFGRPQFFAKTAICRPPTKSMKNFREFIQADRVRVFDGAMGTMIYSKGVYINRSYDELNLSAPDLITSIHRDYIKAGAEIIETNTYGASRLRRR